MFQLHTNIRNIIILLCNGKKDKWKTPKPPLYPGCVYEVYSANINSSMWINTIKQRLGCRGSKFHRIFNYEYLIVPPAWEHMYIPLLHWPVQQGHMSQFFFLLICFISLVGVGLSVVGLWIPSRCYVNNGLFKCLNCKLLSWSYYCLSYMYVICVLKSVMPNN